MQIPTNSPWIRVIIKTDFLKLSNGGGVIILSVISSGGFCKVLEVTEASWLLIVFFVSLGPG